MSAIYRIRRTSGTNLAEVRRPGVYNPVEFEIFDSLTVAADGSATAEIAAALPDSRVLKAFNTTFAGTLRAVPSAP